MDIFVEAKKYITEYFPDTAISENEPLSKHTSFKIGGSVPMLIIPDSTYALEKIYSFFLNRGVMPLVIGNGTNILAEDCPLPFPVIKTHGKSNNIRLISDTELEADCGVTLSSLAVFAMKHELTGLEFAHGIPGSLGGAIYMNAGAYGGEMKDVLYSCNHLDEKGNEGTFAGDELDLSYRHSAYSGKSLVITSLIIKLKKGNKAEIESKMNELMSRRKDKQPLDYPSAGSVFKRPEGYFAGALIEQSGLKGKRIGGAMVSEKHAGFIINYDAATTNDVLELIRFCQQTVKEKFGVDLETEIRSIS